MPKHIARLLILMVLFAAVAVVIAPLILLSIVVQFLPPWRDPEPNRA